MDDKYVLQRKFSYIFYDLFFFFFSWLFYYIHYKDFQLFCRFPLFLSKETKLKCLFVAFVDFLKRNREKYSLCMTTNHGFPY